MAGYRPRFDRLEFSGSLGDLGTLIPLTVALITLTGLNFTAVLGVIGVYYVVSGLYFRLPIPVQPLKVVSAIAIAFPAKITLPLMSATALIFGAILIGLWATGLIGAIARLFTKPIVRGIQLGLGLILIQKGLHLFGGTALLLGSIERSPVLFGVPLNLVVGIGGAAATLFLLNSRRFPAALVVVAGGVIIGLAAGALKGAGLGLGPSEVGLYLPGGSDLALAFWFLVLPQIPLTIGNAIIGTRDAAQNLFGRGEVTARVTDRRLSLSMGLANLGIGLLAAVPLCHGAGGLAAHYRFGARTGGSNIMIGIVFVVVALALGQIGVGLLASIPRAILGVLLVFAGLELALLIRDMNQRAELFISLLIAAVALVTTHMGIAFLVGLAVSLTIKWARVEV